MTRTNKQFAAVLGAFVVALAVPLAFAGDVTTDDVFAAPSHTSAWATEAWA
jgi:hypothetical protein